MLLASIENMQYAVTVDVLHAVISSSLISFSFLNLANTQCTLYNHLRPIGIVICARSAYCQIVILSAPLSALRPNFAQLSPELANLPQFSRGDLDQVTLIKLLNCPWP